MGMRSGEIRWAVCCVVLFFFGGEVDFLVIVVGWGFFG